MRSVRLTRMPFTTMLPPPDTTLTESMDTQPTPTRTPVVRLEQFDPLPVLERSERETSLITELFNSLLRTSADAAVAAEAIFSFQEKCLFFALVHDDSSVGGDNSQKCDAGRRGEATPDERVRRRRQQRNNSLTDAQSSGMGRRTRARATGPSAESPTGDHEREDEAAATTAALGDVTMADMYDDVQTVSSRRFAQTFVGIIYFLQHAHQQNEVSLGLALLPAHCNRGIGPRAVVQVLVMALDHIKFHRVSAAIVDGPTREHAIRMFVALGFAHEGIRRRAVMTAGPGQDQSAWRDVHHLGLLDTDWAINGGAAGLLKSLDGDINKNNGDTEEVGTGKARAKRSRWDELLARHQRECEELIGFDERGKVLRRTLSTETLRPATSAADSGAEASSASESESDVESVVGARDRARSISPGSSIATNPLVSPSDIMTRMQPSLNSVHPSVASGSALASLRKGWESESMVSAWRASLLVDPYGDSEGESDTEPQALKPGARHYSAHTPPRRALVDPVAFDGGAIESLHFASPPPQSDTESVSAYASESEVERYASCEEEEDNDNDDDREGNHANEAPNYNISSRIVLSRLPSGLSIGTQHLEAPDHLVSLFNGYRDAKRRRISEDGIAFDNASPHATSGIRPALTSSSANGAAQLESTPVAGPSSHPSLQNPPRSTPSTPSLSYRLSEREMHDINGGELIVSDAELDWDVLSSASESDSSVASTRSLSLQSASDSE